jgi:glycosyltransferase involved in cell wall biosynthesis
MYEGKSVAVVMPIHNERDHVARAVSRVPAYVDLVIAVDDASTDDTWGELGKLRRRGLVRLRHETNRGVGAATKTGYRHALKLRSDLIAVMDGDGQMHGGDLASLLNRALSGADYVKGNRFLDSATIGRMPRTRWTGNLLLSLLTRLASDFSGSLDAQCGYTVIRRDALARLQLDRLYDRYGFPNEMLFAAVTAGLEVSCVPVRSIYGGEVSGINPFTAVPRILLLIAKGYFSIRARRTRNDVVCFDPGWNRGSESV